MAVFHRSIVSFSSICNEILESQQWTKQTGILTCLERHEIGGETNENLLPNVDRGFQIYGSFSNGKMRWPKVQQRIVRRANNTPSHCMTPTNWFEIIETCTAAVVATIIVIFDFRVRKNVMKKKNVVIFQLSMHTYVLMFVVGVGVRSLKLAACTS